MKYKETRVLIFPDYTSEVMSHRNAFREVMQNPRKKGIKFMLRYPARLQIQHQEGGAPTIFIDPTEAARFMERYGGNSGD